MFQDAAQNFFHTVSREAGREVFQLDGILRLVLGAKSGWSSRL
jgi:hypothetical protein